MPLLSEFSRGMSKDGSFQPIARGRLDPDVQTRGRHREEEQAGVQSGPRAPLHISEPGRVASERGLSRECGEAAASKELQGLQVADEQRGTSLC